MDSTSAAQTILAKLESEVKDPANIAFFTMGILSNWLPKMEDLYLKIKSYVYFFRPCYKAIKFAWGVVKGITSEKSEANTPKEKQDFEAEKAKNDEENEKEEKKVAEFAKKDEETTQKDRTKLCEKTKETIEEIWDKSAEYFIRSKNERSAIKRGNHSWDVERYCNYGLKSEDGKKKAEKSFKSIDDYLAACRYIRENNDCSIFAVDNKGAWYFIKQGLKYANFVRLAGTCIWHVLKVGGKDEASNTPENTEVKTLAESATSGWEVTKMIFKNFGSFLLHILTFGIWGAIKAAWTIIKLTLKLLLMINNFLFDLPFNIGKLIGMALVAIKAFVAGRRRLRKFR